MSRNYAPAHKATWHAAAWFIGTVLMAIASGVLLAWRG